MNAYRARRAEAEKDRRERIKRNPAAYAHYLKQARTRAAKKVAKKKARKGKRKGKKK